MDLTPEYIKMCEKAEEIQNLDWFWLDVEKHRIRSKEANSYGFVDTEKYGKQPVYGDYCILGEEDNPKFVFIPRQDQLQGMLKDRYMYRNAKSWQINILPRFVNFVDEQLGKAFNFHTFEQAWLKFVMYELHNKIWDGEGWVTK